MRLDAEQFFSKSKQNETIRIVLFRKLGEKKNIFLHGKTENVKIENYLKYHYNKLACVGISLKEIIECFTF